MQIAEVSSRRSTCFRRNVGAVIVANKNIIGIGYNGPPAGEPHCTGNGCATEGRCTRATHAEINAIERSRRALYEGRFNRSMYVTESPCPDCAKQIVDQREIMEVFYLNQYRLVEGIDILIAGGIMVWRMTPSGYVIHYLTGELMEID